MLPDVERGCHTRLEHPAKSQRALISYVDRHRLHRRGPPACWHWPLHPRTGDRAPDIGERVGKPAPVRHLRRHRRTGCWKLETGGRKTTSIQHPASSIQYPVSSTQHPVPHPSAQRRMARPALAPRSPAHPGRDHHRPPRRLLLPRLRPPAHPSRHAHPPDRPRPLVPALSRHVRAGAAPLPGARRPPLHRPRRPGAGRLGSHPRRSDPTPERPTGEDGGAIQRGGPSLPARTGAGRAGAAANLLRHRRTALRPLRRHPPTPQELRPPDPCLHPTDHPPPHPTPHRRWPGLALPEHLRRGGEARRARAPAGLRGRYRPAGAVPWRSPLRLSIAIRRIRAARAGSDGLRRPGRLLQDLLAP